jgi:hypothetical protein
MKFKYYMRDCWGDDYTVIVNADTEKEARSIATMLDDDAIPVRLIGVEE